MNFKLHIALAILAWAGIAPLRAAYQYAGEFLNLGAGARAAGMGNTFVALVDDATSCYWNPAGLARLSLREIGFMHAEQFGDLINYDFVAYGVPLKGVGGVSIGLVRLGLDGIKLTTLADTTAAISKDNPILVDRVVGQSDYCLFLSQGRLFPQWGLAMGFTVKLIRRELGDYYAHGLGFDCGVQYTPWPSVNLGLCVKDITQSIMVWDNGTQDRLYPSVHLGIATTVPVQDLHGDVTFAVGSLAVSEIMGTSFISHKLNIRNSELLEPSGAGGIGLEYCLAQKVYLRAGSVMKNLTLGAGLKLKHVSCDYAFIQHDFWDSRYRGDFAATHRVSGGLRF
jgi:hypothetical protein